MPFANHPISPTPADIERGLAAQKHKLRIRGLTLAALVMWPLVGLRMAGCTSDASPQQTDSGQGSGQDKSGDEEGRDSGPTNVLRDAGRSDPIQDAGISAVDAEVGQSDAATPPVGPPDPKLRDVTFFVTSDTHIGRPDIDAAQASMAMIAAMEAAPGAVYPEGLGLTTVAAPRGVMITGDLTDDNRMAQWNTFDAIWGANGQGAIHFPVFEGWGNHDFHSGREDVRAAMHERHLRRDYPINLSEGNGDHYSWDFHDVHLVHLNLYPGMEGGLSTFAPANNNPRKSLEFLADDLAKRVAGSTRPVVIFFHYGFDSNGGSAWVESEREAFYKVITGYNVVGLFVGHSHAQGFTQVSSKASGISGQTFNVYMADDTLTAANKSGFYVVHLGPEEMVVAERKIGATTPWGFVRKTSLLKP